MEVDDDDVSLKDGRVKLLKRRKGDVQAGEEEWAWLSVRVNGVEYSVRQSS